MILDAVTKSLEIVLAGVVTANQLHVVSSWADITTAAFTPGETDAQSNNTTAVTIVAAPAASTQRQIKEVIVYNKDTASATVIIQYNNNSTIRILVRITLLTLETLVYREGIGLMVLDTNGAIKTLISLFSHHLTHESGGSDAMQLDNLAAPDDNTDLDALTSKHGLMPKADKVKLDGISDQSASHYLKIGNILICWGRIDFTVSNNSNYDSSSISFPCAYKSGTIPTCSAFLSDTAVLSANWVGEVHTETNTTFKFRMMEVDATPRTGTYTMGWFSIGVWQ